MEVKNEIAKNKIQECMKKGKVIKEYVKSKVTLLIIQY